MKNPRNREMMAAVYRLFEKYETVPKDGGEVYWVELVDACNVLCSQYPVNKVLVGILSGLVDGLNDEWEERYGQA